MEQQNTIICANPTGQDPPCQEPAMLERMPHQKSSRHLHKMCFRCACRFHKTSSEAQLAQSALVDYWKATATNQ